KSIAFLQDSRLLSRRICHKHHFLEPFRMLIPYLLIATDRIGTFAPVPIRYLDFLPAELQYSDI
ncbi:hypothetical protein, partial [Salmonella enterica]|uniref:hypothetical protein n=1 Tax=Salmonella enterica TaxID=28901 RepID=UPI001A91B94A